ncbi:hypothetical protein WA1_11620 [Scytonema hofmannii PCC 7110]|uniref:Bestrophin n=1 Tax=Scytonema hofmannii PCC 7110 TaxID=128403 RepID=A0A139XDK2_9CYAN|nr:bestrophin family ion channel [Scytonema hofmannii]KYC42777.1 hypothetical protein WA1_11620 [Scytonema hofmannii PCC 7110]
MKKRQWLKLALQIKGSVIPSIYHRVIFIGAFAIFISVLYHFKIPVSQPTFGSVIPSVVLGLLLVFRTNTAYDRFWEGRRLWGIIVNDSRNLSWLIWVTINNIEREDRAKKIAAMRLVAAFSVATKLHLRSELVNSELEELMPRSQYLRLKSIKHTPLEIAIWIGDYLQQQYQHKCVDSVQVTAMQATLKSMIDCVGGCERILKTPLPLAYSIHIKQLLLIYCLLLPFHLVQDLGLFTSPVVALVSFTVFGVEEIGLEIENPFGHDPNDLPLDAICTTIRSNIEELIAENSDIQ